MFEEGETEAQMAKKSEDKPTLSYIDLFCGIGGFRIAVSTAAKKYGYAAECVLSSDIDEKAQDAYEANFGERPVGDITKVDETTIPNHDILLGGFPCQAFSIIGEGKGFKDTRGTLFFDVARILKEKRPPAFVLENVKQLRGHDSGRTLQVILSTLLELGYWVDYKILNALDFGVAQKRERILIVGFLQGTQHGFAWPKPTHLEHVSLEDVLEEDSVVPAEYFASERIAMSRRQSVKGKQLPSGRSIWHENKSGNISALPYSCALRAGASYNYLLVDGVRRLTMREMLRLQGFPEKYKIVCNYSDTRKQAGNSVPVPMITAVLKQVVEVIKMNRDGVPIESRKSPVSIFQEALALDY
jgi:DNA (cytosine-5)-methyltransferase 1